MKQQFDFRHRGGEGDRSRGAVVCLERRVRGVQDEIEMVRQLEETGRYRILRKLNG